MYVRLAFAVAAHLEPEILIVDEVLAVGDPEFQKKCLGKMDDVVSKKDAPCCSSATTWQQSVSSLPARVLLNKGAVELTEMSRAQSRRIFRTEQEAQFMREARSNSAKALM